MTQHEIARCKDTNNDCFWWIYERLEISESEELENDLYQVKSFSPKPPKNGWNTVNVTKGKQNYLIFTQGEGFIKSKNNFFSP